MCSGTALRPRGGAEGGASGLASGFVSCYQLCAWGLARYAEGPPNTRSTASHSSSLLLPSFLFILNSRRFLGFYFPRLSSSSSLTALSSRSRSTKEKYEVEVVTEMKEKVSQSTSRFC